MPLFGLSVYPSGPLFLALSVNCHVCPVMDAGCMNYSCVVCMNNSVFGFGTCKFENSFHMNGSCIICCMCICLLTPALCTTIMKGLHAKVVI
jgi:hypothetical protein